MAKNDFDELILIGIESGKSTFYLVGFDLSGQLVSGKQIKRLTLSTATKTKWLAAFDLKGRLPLLQFFADSILLGKKSCACVRC